MVQLTLWQLANLYGSHLTLGMLIANALPFTVIILAAFMKSLPVGMVGFRDAYQTNYAQMSAGIVFSVLPVMIIYAVLQKQIIEGLTAGGVKG